MSSYLRVHKIKRFWQLCNEWDLEKIMPHRGMLQRAYIDKYFIPLLEETDTIVELGCGSGVPTLQVAPFVQSIEAYDMSEAMIATACAKARELGIDHVSFNVSFVERVRLKNKYSHAMILGLLTYIEQDRVAKNIINKLYNVIEASDNTKGYLLVKDSVAHKESVFYETNDYVAYYRSEEAYLALYENFTLIHKEYLLDYNEQGVGSIICIFKKKT